MDLAVQRLQQLIQLQLGLPPRPRQDLAAQRHGGRLHPPLPAARPPVRYVRPGVASDRRVPSSWLRRGPRRAAAVPDDSLLVATVVGPAAPIPLPRRRPGTPWKPRQASLLWDQD